MTSRELFIKYLKEQQWSMAASVSINAMRVGGREEIEWYFHQLMNTCNRWRVVRMVKTWLDSDSQLDMWHSYGDQFHNTYGHLVMGALKEHSQTDLQRQRREEFRVKYFKAYPVTDRLVMWIAQGAAERETQ